jgi:hypothetical protein
MKKGICWRLIASIFCIIVLPYLTASADIFSSITPSSQVSFHMKSGKVMTGEVLKKGNHFIKIDFEGVPITIYDDEIDNINVLTKASSSPVPDVETKVIVVPNVQPETNQNAAPPVAVKEDHPIEEEQPVKEVQPVDDSPLFFQDGPRQVTYVREEAYSDQGVVVGGNINTAKNNVNGVETPSTMIYGTLFLLPIAKATELTAKYGDILQCSNAGKEETKASTMAVNLIAANDMVKTQMKRIFELVNSNLDNDLRKIPVIQIESFKLRKISDKVVLDGHEIPGGIDDPLPIYLVNDVRIVKEDFRDTWKNKTKQN